MQGRADHIIIKIPPERKKTDGGLILPDISGKRKLLGRILTIGTLVQDKSLERGMIAVFDANGIIDVRLNEFKQKTLYVAITEMQLLMTVDEEDLEREGADIPEPLDAQQDEETSKLHAAV